MESDADGILILVRVTHHPSYVRSKPTACLLDQSLFSKVAGFIIAFNVITVIQLLKFFLKCPTNSQPFQMAPSFYPIPSPGSIRVNPLWFLTPCQV